MLRRKVLLAATVSAISALSACRTQKPEILETQTSGLDQALIEKSVLQGAAARGWSTKLIRPGYIVATYSKSGLVACVDIRYNENSFSISKNSKTNMDNESGEVSSKYVKWVKNLNKTINRYISRQSR